MGISFKYIFKIFNIYLKCIIIVKVYVKDFKIYVILKSFQVYL